MTDAVDVETLGNSSNEPRADIAEKYFCSMNIGRESLHISISIPNAVSNKCSSNDWKFQQPTTS